MGEKERIREKHSLAKERAKQWPAGGQRKGKWKKWGKRGKNGDERKGGKRGENKWGGKGKGKYYEIWEEKSKPFPPLTCMLPALVRSCSEHCPGPVPSRSLWLADNSEAGRARMELSLKADRPRCKDQQDSTNHGSIQDLQQTRPLFGNGWGIALTWCVCSTGNWI